MENENTKTPSIIDKIQDFAKENNSKILASTLGTAIIFFSAILFAAFNPVAIFDKTEIVITAFIIMIISVIVAIYGALADNNRKWSDLLEDNNIPFFILPLVLFFFLTPNTMFNNNVKKHLEVVHASHFQTVITGNETKTTVLTFYGDMEVSNQLFLNKLKDISPLAPVEITYFSKGDNVLPPHNFFQRSFKILK